MQKEPEVRVFSFAHSSPALFGQKEGQESLSVRIKKAARLDAERRASAQGASTGVQQRPFDFEEVIDLKDFNTHHSTCIEAKVGATVGLGFKTEGEDELIAQGRMTEIDFDTPTKESEVLDALCDVSFQDALNDAVEDYWQVGNGYLEIVRDGDSIAGVYHLPTNDVDVVIEDDDEGVLPRHYEIRQSAGFGTTRKFAVFGDKDEFLSRNPGHNPESVSEVIHLRRSSARSRYFGYPDWLSAIPSIELVQALHQFAYDFFLNRGVPEFMLFVKGAKIGDEDWKAIESAVKATIGLGNSHKTLAINIPDQNITIQLERLGIDGQGEDHFREKSETLSVQIVSAHRVPPLLAGIQIPGKLGSNNELPNALRAFQKLVIGKAQNEIRTILRCTLGNTEINGGLGLDENDFRLRSITDVLDLQKMDTSSRMRETEAEADAEGRDLDAGLEKAAEDLLTRIRRSA